MNILYHHRIRADDGQAVHVREMIRALRAEGHFVEECALVPKAVEAGSVGPEREGRGRGGPARGAFWRRLSLPRVATELLEIAYDRQGARMLRAAAERMRSEGRAPDVLYERHALHCASGLRAARRLGIPLLLEVNSPMCDEMRALGLLRFGFRARAVERRVLRGADAVLAVSAVLRQRLVELGADPQRTHVVRNGADPSRYEGVVADRARLLAPPGPAAGFTGDEDAFVLGFVGYARPWHRLDLAARVLAMPGFERAYLVVAGEGPAIEPLRALAAGLGVADRLRLLGRVAASALPAVVAGFDASLIPAINPYASPLKAFDALAAGVPVVAPRQPNLVELFEDGVDGMLFDADETGEGLARALRGLVADPDGARAVGAAGRRALDANGWTWRGQARRVVGHAERLLESSRPIADPPAMLSSGGGAVR